MVETDITTSIKASPIGEAAILVIMFFGLFKTDVILLFLSVMLYYV